MEEPEKEFYDLRLSKNSVNAIQTLIGVGLKYGATNVQDAKGNVMCTLAELTVDLKREIQSQLK